MGRRTIKNGIWICELPGESAASCQGQGVRKKKKKKGEDPGVHSGLDGRGACVGHDGGGPAGREMTNGTV